MCTAPLCQQGEAGLGVGTDLVAVRWRMLWRVLWRVRWRVLWRVLWRVHRLTKVELIRLVVIVGIAMSQHHLPACAWIVATKVGLALIQDAMRIWHERHDDLAQKAQVARLKLWIEAAAARRLETPIHRSRTEVLSSTKEGFGRPFKMQLA